MSSAESPSSQDVRSLLAKGEFEAAQTLLRGRGVVAPSDPEFLNHLKLLREAGRAEDALALASEFLQKKSDSGGGASSSLAPQLKTEVEIEQARSLMRTGAVREGLARLIRGRWNESTKKSVSYRMALIQGHVSRWRYEAALPLIDSLIAENLTDEFDRRLLQTTRVGALVFLGHLQEALSEAPTLYQELINKNSFVLAARMIETMAQLYWELGDSARLKAHLGVARAFFHKHSRFAGPQSEFIIDRWTAMADIAIGAPLSEEQRVSFAARIAELSGRAAKSGSRDAAIDADLFAVLILRDEEKLARLFFMSPYPSFRSYLKRMCARIGLAIPRSATIAVGQAKTKRFSFTIENGSFSNGEVFRSSGMSYRILAALLRDAYGAVRTAELFHEIYPEEIYDPLTSARRVQQAVRRFKTEIAAIGVALELETVVGGYRIVEDRTCINLVVSEDWLKMDEVDRALAVDLFKLKTHFGRSQFTIGQAADQLQRPVRSTQHLLRRIIDLNYLARLGDGRASRYALLSSN